MQTYKLVVLLNAFEGQDAAFNQWFTDVHLPDALKIPGIVGGQRFALSEAQHEGASRQWQYLTLYEVCTDDLLGVMAEIKRRAGTPDMVGTETIAPGGFLHFFEPITDWVAAPRTQA